MRKINIFSKFSKKHERDYNLILNEFINSYSLIVDPQHLINSTKGRLREFFPIKNCTFFFRNDKYFYNKQIDELIPVESRLVNWLKVNSTFLDLKKKPAEYPIEVLEKFSFLKTNFIFPLETHNNMIGIVFITSDNLSKNELSFLKNVFRLTAIAYDNSQRIIQEKEKIKENLNKEKKSVVSGIASMMAHEIKNPLTSIRSTIQFISNSIEDHEMKELSGSLISEVDRINQITESVLNFARPRKLAFSNIELFELIQSVQELYSTILNNKGIDFIIDNKIKHIVINADEQALRQVLINFMKNSMEALEENHTGEIKVVYNEKENWIEWQDNGCGIPQNKIEKIFEPFYTSKKKGNGLGLAISKKIMEEMNFNLQVKSKVGRGTVFYFTLL